MACVMWGGVYESGPGAGWLSKRKISSLPNGVRPLSQPATNAFDARTMTTLTNGVKPTNGTPAYSTAPDPPQRSTRRVPAHALSRLLLPHFFRPGGEGADQIAARACASP